jgi:hypothetical protein
MNKICSSKFSNNSVILVSSLNIELPLHLQTYAIISREVVSADQV